MRNINKLGHQAPKGCRINKFNSIEINGDFAYCDSHNFVYNPEIEKEKQYNALPCHYTDGRYQDGLNFYHSAKLYWTRFKDISLKACIRKTLKCKNIPIGTTVSFNKSWYYVGKNIDNSFKFKVKKENSFNPEYQINLPSYSAHFSNCEYSKELTNELRKNGFIVRIIKNSSFLMDMVNTASAITGKGNFIDSTIDGEIAIAYGYGKKIGFSSFKNDFQGYSNGCENILWDKFNEFNKWSRCEEISKTTPIDEIIDILKKN